MKIIYLSVVVVLTSSFNWRNVSEPSFLKVDFKEVGRLIYPEHSDDVASLITSYHSNESRFLRRNKKLFDYYGFSKINEFNLLYIFGESKELLKNVEWHGEEEEGELEAFVEKKLLSTKIEWSSTRELREEHNDSDHNDGVLIIKLFQSVDADLKESGHGLLFFNMGSDSYTFLVLNRDNIERIKNLAPQHFMIASELKE